MSTISSGAVLPTRISKGPAEVARRRSQVCQSRSDSTLVPTSPVVSRLTSTRTPATTAIVPERPAAAA